MDSCMWQEEKIRMMPETRLNMLLAPLADMTLASTLGFTLPACASDVPISVWWPLVAATLMASWPPLRATGPLPTLGSSVRQWICHDAAMPVPSYRLETSW